MTRLVLFFVALLLLVGGVYAARQVSSSQPVVPAAKSESVSAPLGSGASTMSGQSQGRGANPSTVPLVKRSEKSDISPALRTLPARVTRMQQPAEEAKDN